MRNPLRLVVCSLFVAIVLILPGCLQSPPDQTKILGETLTFSWNQDVGPLNPHRYGPSQLFAQDLIFEPLVSYDRGGTIKPALAERWEAAPDGKLLTFTLRQGVKFSDGEPFNAAVAKANFDQILRNPQDHDWLGLVQAIDRVVAKDDRTFQIYLKTTYYPALQELSLIRPVRFLSPRAFPDKGATSQAIKAPIGTGPWVLTEYQKDAQAVFMRNEQYWGNKPSVKKLVVKIIPDSETRMLAFENQEIDLIYGNTQISLDGFKALRDAGRYLTETSRPLATRAIAMNSNRNATRDLKVRQAIQHIVNKDAIVQGIFYNLEPKADTYFSPEVPYANIGLKPYDYDVNQAKTLLDAAGWRRQSEQAVRMKDGQSLTLALSFHGDNVIDKAIAQAVQADFKAIGIELKLVGEEKQSWRNRQEKGEFDLIFNETWGPPYEPQAMISSMRVPSNADYAAQKGLPMKGDIDRQIGEILQTTDLIARRNRYRKLFTTLHEQAVYLPISYSTHIAVMHKNWTGFEFMPQTYQIPVNQLKPIAGSKS
jgi:nickel transport system substrate-binding protein